jgi:hypothetical protein
MPFKQVHQLSKCGLVLLGCNRGGCQRRRRGPAEEEVCEGEEACEKEEACEEEKEASLEGGLLRRLRGGGCLWIRKRPAEEDLIWLLFWSKGQIGVRKVPLG